LWREYDRLMEELGKPVMKKKGKKKQNVGYG
jgi:hypothetical protein